MPWCCVRRVPWYSFTKKVGDSASCVMIVIWSEYGSSDGTVAAYMGDDERFDYLYSEEELRELVRRQEERIRLWREQAAKEAPEARARTGAEADARAYLAEMPTG